MGAHRQVAGARVVEAGHHRRRLVALHPAPLEDEPHRVLVGHAAVEGLAHRDVELGGAVAFEEPGKAVGQPADVVAALGGGDAEVMARRRCAVQAVEAAVLAGGGLVLDERKEWAGSSTC